MADFDIPYFRHSVNDEPNDDWTVEEVFQWTLLRSYQLIDERCDKVAQNLRNEFQEGGKQLEQVRKEVDEKQAPLEQSENRPNVNTKSAAEAATSTRAPRSAVIFQAKVVESEVYMGRVFELKVTKKNHCLVGRSSSKKFKTNGMSLSKDLEVSTTHGKFELHKDGNVYYTDTGSTNGSKVDGVSVEVDVPRRIETGTILLVGTTKFEFTIM